MKYVYEPLQTRESIRIMELEPGAFEDPLKCNLRQITSHADDYAYLALSYVWGRSEDRYNLIIEPAVGDETATLPITPNLWDALKHLRARLGKLHIWIDAISINQSDDGERGHQVSLMGEIYARASTVIVWLGKADGDTLDVVKFADAVYNYCEGMLADELKVVDRLGELAERFNVLELPTFDKEWREAAVQLFTQRDWFERVWVIQEVNAGAEVIVQIGEHSLKWDAIGIMAMWLREAQWSETGSGEGSERLRNAMMMWQERFRSKAEALDLLDDARDYKASDTRDKIYALLGFPAIRNEAPVVPIYENKTIVDVYRDFVLTYITTTRKLDVLSYVEHPAVLENRDILDRTPVETWPNFPSWIPNWAEQTFFPTSSFASFQHYTTVYVFQKDPGLSSHGGLVVRGSIVAQVKGIADSLAWTVQPRLANLNAILAFWKSMASLDCPTDVEDRRISLAHAMTAGMNYYNEVVQPQNRLHLSDFVAFIRDSWELAQRISPNAGANDALNETLDDLVAFRSLLDTRRADSFRYLQAAYLVCPSRRLFYDERGLAGIGHSQVMSGDVVARLDGSVMLFVLRRWKDYYQVVGECFLFQSSALEPAEWQDVELR